MNPIFIYWLATSVLGILGLIVWAHYLKPETITALDVVGILIFPPLGAWLIFPFLLLGLVCTGIAALFEWLESTVLWTRKGSL